MTIDSFKGGYGFLSNFYMCTVLFDGISYCSSENAYQAQKVEPSLRQPFALVTPGVSKRMGKNGKIRSDWESVKDGIMLSILRAKFQQNLVLALRLRNTGNEILIEGNTWGDTYWGVCNGVGHNKLGRMLMQVRSELPV